MSNRNWIKHEGGWRCVVLSFDVVVLKLNFGGWKASIGKIEGKGFKRTRKFTSSFGVTRDEAADLAKAKIGRKRSAGAK